MRIVCILAALLGVIPSAWSQRGPAPGPSPRAPAPAARPGPPVTPKAVPGAATAHGGALAEQLLAKGIAALAAQDHAGARAALEQAFQIYPDPKVLYYLGATAAAEQRTVEAHDLIRRFLADPAVEPGEPLRPEAQRLLDQIEGRPLAEAGDVSVLGPRGALVRVDQRLVGALPLPLPLLLASGPHVVAVTQQKWRAETEVQVKTARLAELRYKAGSDVVVVSRPRTVLLLDEWQLGDGVSAEPLTQALGAAVRRELLLLLPRATALAYAKDLSGCLSARGARTAPTAKVLTCQQKLGERFGAAYVLSARAVREGGPGVPQARWQTSLGLLDVEVGELAGTAAPECPGCTLDQAATRLGEACSKLLTDAALRPHGSLEVASTPPGAEVRMDDRVVGVTPYRRTLWAGTYPIEVRARGFQPFVETVTVGADQPARVQAELVPATATAAASLGPDGKPGRPVELQRPRWRIGVGIAAIAAGMTVGGFGISALTQRGCVAEVDPVTMRCTRDYDTTGIGGGLLGAGAALTITGVVLLALPPRQKSTVR